MGRKGPFVPTHRVKVDQGSITSLSVGTLVRQINPFAGSDSELYCLDATDWVEGGPPWYLFASDLEPLDNWPEEREKMRKNILSKNKQIEDTQIPHHTLEDEDPSEEIPAPDTAGSPPPSGL